MLSVDAQALALLLAGSDFILEQDGALDSDVILGLQVLERRGRVASLSFEIIVGYLNVAQLQLEGAVEVTKGGDLLLESVLSQIRFVLGFPVLALHNIRKPKFTVGAKNGRDKAHRAKTYFPLFHLER